MKKMSLFCLTAFIIILSAFPLYAGAEPTIINTYDQNNSRWGEDVIIAAIYPYGWSRRNRELNCEGVMFPIYMGYFSFDDSGDEKMVYFTPNPNSNLNTRSIESLCEEINRSREVPTGGEWAAPIDSKSFGGVLWDKLRNWNIREVVRLPLGTAQNYDFAFREQTQFFIEEADRKFEQNELFGGLPSDYGITLGNLIITPKQ